MGFALSSMVALLSTVSAAILWAWSQHTNSRLRRELDMAHEDPASGLRRQQADTELFRTHF